MKLPGLAVPLIHNYHLAAVSGVLIIGYVAVLEGPRDQGSSRQAPLAPLHDQNQAPILQSTPTFRRPCDRLLDRNDKATRSGRVDAQLR